MRVFLTGTAGFIGDPFARRLTDADHAVAGLAGVSRDDAIALSAGPVPGRSRTPEPVVGPRSRDAASCGA
jgi:nucleoside-diphosphate-sugar epimerase